MLEGMRNAPLWMAGISVILAIVPLIKLFHHIIHANRSYKTQSLETLYKVLGTSENVSNRLVVEQLFASQFKLQADYDTILILLGFSSPTKAIRLYRNSEKYLKVFRGCFDYEDRYKSSRARRLESYFRPFVNVSLYFLFAMIAAYSVLYVYRSFDENIIFETDFIVFNGLLWGVASLISILCAIKAVAFLTDTTNIKDAEALMALTDTHKKTPKWCY